jgi:hypothetical protein
MMAPLKLIQFSRFIEANSTDLNIQMKVFSDDAETFDFLADPAARPHPNCPCRPTRKMICFEKNKWRILLLSIFGHEDAAPFVLGF